MKRPIGHWSRFLIIVEPAYDITTARLFRYLFCTSFTSISWLYPVYYPNRPRFASRITRLADATKRLARLRLLPSEFYFDVVHCAGIKRQAVDVISRIPTLGNENRPLEDELPALLIASGNEMDSTITTIFSLEAHKGTPTYSATSADGTVLLRSR